MNSDVRGYPTKRRLGVQLVSTPGMGKGLVCPLALCCSHSPLPFQRGCGPCIQPHGPLALPLEANWGQADRGGHRLSIAQSRLKEAAQGPGVHGDTRDGCGTGDPRRCLSLLYQVRQPGSRYPQPWAPRSYCTSSGSGSPGLETSCTSKVKVAGVSRRGRERGVTSDPRASPGTDKAREGAFLWPCRPRETPERVGRTRRRQQLELQPPPELGRVPGPSGCFPSSPGVARGSDPRPPAHTHAHTCTNP